MIYLNNFFIVSCKNYTLLVNKMRLSILRIGGLIEIANYDICSKLYLPNAYVLLYITMEICTYSDTHDMVRIARPAKYFLMVKLSPPMALYVDRCRKSSYIADLDGPPWKGRVGSG